MGKNSHSEVHMQGVHEEIACGLYNSFHRYNLIIGGIVDVFYYKLFIERAYLYFEILSLAK